MNPVVRDVILEIEILQFKQKLHSKMEQGVTY